MGDYLVRATVDHNWAAWFSDPKDQRFLLPGEMLPLQCGPFILDVSKNHKVYMRDLGWDDEATDSLDSEHPYSYLCVESKLTVSDETEALETTNRMLQWLECLLRLFQPGGVFVRRHRLLDLSQDPAEPVGDLVIYWPNSRLSRAKETLPEPPRHEDRGAYDLRDDRIGEFLAFFQKYWPVLEAAEGKRDVPIQRFSRAYESRSDGERLVDLMIALEAIVGEPSETTYKVGLRAASLLYPPGQERRETFLLVKGVYDERSRLLHGRALDVRKVTRAELDQFEDIVRKVIVKWLGLGPATKPMAAAEFDRYVLGA